MTAWYSIVPNATSVGNPSGPVICGMISEPDTLTSSTVTTLLESNNCVSALLGAAPGGNNVKQMSITYSPQKNLGLSYSDDTIGAAFDSNPSVQWYATIWAAETGFATSTTINVRVEIEYTILCTRQTDPNGS